MSNEWRKAMHEGYQRAFMIYYDARQRIDIGAMTFSEFIDWMDDEFDKLLDKGESDEICS